MSALIVAAPAPLPAVPSASYHDAVCAFKRQLIESTLRGACGNRTHAARALGLQRTYLLRLIRELRVTAPPPPTRGRPAGAGRARTGPDGHGGVRGARGGERPRAVVPEAGAASSHAPGVRHRYPPASAPGLARGRGGPRTPADLRSSPRTRVAEPARRHARRRLHRRR